MTEMSKAEVARFLMQGTFTGKLATVKKDGSPHVVPIWFVVENGKGRGKAGNTHYWRYVSKSQQYSARRQSKYLHR
jgi:nitroimidazol reductase NimA-like FMN-containing flavoprotein (pyridoxamine 5'-phosphate oxidase superfamily)